MRRLWIIYLVVSYAAIGEYRTALAGPYDSPSPLLSQTAAGSSSAPQLSADGRFIVFASHAKNLTTNQFTGFALNLFRRDLLTGQTLLISSDLTGTGGGDDNSAFYSISADGRYVAFSSSAANLVADDTNSAADIFLWDALTLKIQLLTTNVFGTGPVPDANGSSVVPLSSNPQISGDGRWVVFESRSSNLVNVMDATNTLDVFACDTRSNATFLVSVNTAGTATTGDIYSAHSPRIANNGRFVLFLSTTPDLVAAAVVPGHSHLYLRDLQDSVTKWITKDLETALGYNSNAYNIVEHSISENGQVIAFKVNAPGNSPPATWLFRYSINSGSLLLLTTDSHQLSTPQLSLDGRFLAYESGTNVLIWDEVFKTNLIVNLDSSNARPAAGISRSPALSADGRSIAFVSNAGDLVPGGSGGQFQIYWRDLIERFTFLASVNTNGEPADADHELVIPTISADGFSVAFESSATDFLDSDLNHAVDVFAFNFLADPQVTCASAAAPTKPARTGPGQMSLSRSCITADGRVLAFFGNDSAFAPDDTNRLSDLIVHDFAAGTNRSVRFSTNALVDAEISADGRYVTCTRLLEAAFQGHRDEIVRFDLLTGEKQSLKGSSFNPLLIDLFAPAHAMSSDGRLVAFASTATDLDSRDSASDIDVFVHDFVNGTNLLVSINAPGDATSPQFAPDDQHMFYFSRIQLFVARVGQANPASLVSHHPQDQTSPVPLTKAFTISGNSQRVVFDSSTDNRSLYLNHLASNAVSLVCSNCQNGALNGDGRWLAYEHLEGFTSAIRSVVLQDLETGISYVVSSNCPSGGPCTNRPGLPSDPALDSFSPLITRDGRYVVFLSRVRTAVPSPTRLYAYDRVLDQGILLTPGPDGIGLVTDSGPQLQFARDGRTLVFRSFADLVEGDYNDNRDVFVLRLGSGDQDNDGLDDDWEMAYFGNLDRDGSGDFDHDGRTDREEFLSGTDPTDEDSVLRVLTLSRASGGTTIFWYADPSRSYRVEYKNSVTDPSWATALGEVRLSGETGYLTDSSANSAARFYRVVALP